MNRYPWRVIAAAVALGVGLAGPSWAADPPQRGTSVGAKVQSKCPAGWKLLPGGTKDNYFCAPPKIKLTCPPDTHQVERNCAVGCEPNIK